ncbi:MAG: hypothetical protein ACE14T_05380 [Syntrophales bacterium]
MLEDSAPLAHRNGFTEQPSFQTTPGLNVCGGRLIIRRNIPLMSRRSSRLSASYG